MPVCINEAKPGGKIRYEWTNGKGGGFYLTGEYLELEPYRRIVHVERMHLPDATPDNHVETRFDPDGAGTLMTMRMTLPDAQTRAAMLATGMEQAGWKPVTLVWTGCSSLIRQPVDVPAPGLQTVDESPRSAGYVGRKRLRCVLARYGAMTFRSTPAPGGPESWTDLREAP